MDKIGSQSVKNFAVAGEVIDRFHKRSLLWVFALQQLELVLSRRGLPDNAITEGFHRKMKLIQRRAYGFRSFQNYRLRVIAQCG